MTTTPDKKHEDRIRELDGWRAISVALVITEHLAGSHSQTFLDRAGGSAAHVIRYLGWLGVSVFFVISGFVICRLLILEEKRYGSISLKGFYCRRVFRILPPFYIYMAVVCLLLAGGLIHEDWRQIVVSSFFLANVRFLPQDFFVGHIWSLSVEEQFYIVFPTLWVLTPNHRRGNLFAGVLGLLLLWTAALSFSHGRVLFELKSRAGFCSICIGVLVAIYEREARRFAASLPALLVILAGAVVLLHPTPNGNLIDGLFTSMVEPAVIAGTLMFTLERGGRFRSLLISRPMQTVGVTSYGIYLWQQLFTAGRNQYTDRGAWMWYGLPLLLVIVPLSYRYIEAPFMKIGKTLSRRMKVALPEMPAEEAVVLTT